MKKNQQTEPPEPPFTLDLSSRNTLADQMANALRLAIASGRYRPGEQLPTVREWMRMLGVCTHVPETALARLAREGLVVARPRHGCIVAPRGASIFRGHVLLVMPPEDYSRNANVMCGRIVRRLEGAGYLVSYAMTPTPSHGRHDFSRLRIALRQSVDLAVFLYWNAAAARCAKSCGVPFVTISTGYVPGGVGHVRTSCDRAFERLADDFRAHGVSSVEVVCKGDGGGEFNPADVLARTGMDVSVTEILKGMTSAPDEMRVEFVQRRACETFAARFNAKRRPRFRDVLYFTDDCALQGAVPALLANGVRIPEDVRLASIANKGFGPVFPFPFARVEMDSFGYGDSLADAILSYFDDGTFPPDVALECTFSAM